MDELTDIAHSTSRFFCESLKSGVRRAEVFDLLGSSDAFLLARSLAEGQRPLFILTPDSKSAARLHSDLQFYYPEGHICLFPRWDVTPFEAISPHPDVEATRLATLSALHHGRVDAVVMPVAALMQRVIPRAVLEALCETLVLEGEYERKDLLRRLLALGYRSSPLVEDRGTFSSRGDILDIYPPTLDEPVRMEFYGDDLERMRPFDPATQRTRGLELKTLELLPSRELVLQGEFFDLFAERLRSRCDELELPRTVRDAILEEVREGLLSPGREFLLPLNYGRLDSVFDYASQGIWCLFDPPQIEREIDQFEADILEGERRAATRKVPHVDRQSLYLGSAELEEALGSVRRIEFCSLKMYRLAKDREVFRFNLQGNADLRLERGMEEAGLKALAERIALWRDEGWRVLLSSHQQGQARRLSDLLSPFGLELPEPGPCSLQSLKAGEIGLRLGELSAGFRLPDEKLVVITEEEIFGQRARRRGRSEARLKASLASLAQLKSGDFVVHADHGIAIYRGLIHLEMGTVEGDFLHLEYAGADKFYLPVERIEKVQKYVGGEGHKPRLDKMGGGAWEKAKLKARAAAEEMARELLKIYAKRELKGGFQFSEPDRMYCEFEAGFPYEETPDQLGAIQDVISDMCSEKPMDRLVCGDVGFGKTEVAVRAAFKAALDSKQAAVLVPTTVLVRQHFETFRERLKGYPVRIEQLSRFSTAAANKKILQELSEGKIDIIIGTHRLLQRDVHFKDLGLLVVDEEQRFGVSHKERLKRLRAEVDLLTLTATPIPRTLHMSMTGLRDLSVIDTPPVDRLAIRTYVSRFEDDIIREAILRELQRGGQVFFVHNRVQNIEAMAEFLRSLVPEAKVAVGHGQMGAHQLEDVMVDFVEGNTNVLVCSTIIENGIDIPRANTIIVNRADCFGLSQLYQLRGRVGRSNRRAYAYLLIPGESTLTRDARERLKVLQEMTEMGAGFRIASHDLEIRGAGDLIGANQSGQLASIGLEMYTDLLQETIAELKGLEHEEQVDPEIRLGLNAFLPETYMPDPNQRLVFYKRLASAPDDQGVYDLFDELRDRYGEPPAPTLTLLEQMRLRVQLKQAKVEALDYDGRNLVYAFHQRTPVSPEKILALLQRDARRYRFTPDYRLTVGCGKQEQKALLELARKELQSLF